MGNTAQSNKAFYFCISEAHSCSVFSYPSSVTFVIVPFKKRETGEIERAGMS